MKETITIECYDCSKIITVNDYTDLVLKHDWVWDMRGMNALIRCRECVVKYRERMTNPYMQRCKDYGFFA